MIARLLAILRSRAVRIAFLLIAFGFGVWAVIAQWDAITQAVASVSPWVLPAALLLSSMYVLSTFEAWRVLLVEQGMAISRLAAARVFFLSQLGKYLPGGVWNILAAAELGKDHDIPRSRSVVVMVESVLISICTGLALGVLGLVLSPGDLLEQLWWVLPLFPLFVALLIPPVLNRIVSTLLRRLGRDAAMARLSGRAIGVAVVWSVVAWILAGAQVWVLGVGLGMEMALATYGLATTAYALAWTVGFLAVLAPAGVGIREAVLGAIMASQLSLGATVAVVLLARFVLTIVDAMFGLGFLRPWKERVRRG